jgi:YhcH/YjgK/YiaL family protein
MIVDKIQNIGRYIKLVKNADKIADYFKENALDAIAQAKEKISIAGTEYTFSPYEIKAVPSKEKRWEIHRDHIDIHIVLIGKEYVEWLPAEYLKNSIEYKTDADVEFFSDSLKGSPVLLEPGYFCLCMPEDAHKPSISGDGTYGIKTLVKAAAV